MAKKSAARKSDVRRDGKRAAKRVARRAVKRAATKTAKKAARRAVQRPAAKKAAPKRPAKAKATAKTRTSAKARPGVKRAKPRTTRKPAASPARDVVVVVGESDIPQIHKVATQLRSRGLKVDSILESTGMITGTTAKQPAALSRVKGVTAVEATPAIQLPPPGSDIQ
jgi:hypothetical protein